MRHWDEIVTPLGDCAVHWSMLHRGRIMVRNDASTNLSPAMYEEFARPCDQRLLAELGGGGIHFCGRGDHLIAQFSQLSGLYAINTTQPALNDVETIFAVTVDQRINLLGFERDIAEQALQRGRPLRGRVHCW
jgi:uroporphyrinogen-III decarboxylase